MIEFIRGDSQPFKTKISFQDKTAIKIEDIETLYITARQYAKKNSPILFQKTLEDVTIDGNGFCHAVFEPEDTEDLLYGEYYFDIEITLNNGYRKSKLFRFKITDETTIHEGVENGN